MKTTYAFSLTLLFAAACSGPRVATVEREPQASPAFSPTLGQSPTPSLTPTPTEDYAAQIAIEQLNLQRSLGSATVDAMTQTFVDSRQATLDAQMRATRTATTAAGQTQEAHALETQSAITTATAYAPIQRQNEVRASFEPVWQFFLLSAAVFLTLLSAWCLGALTKAGLALLHTRRLACTAERAEPTPVSGPGTVLQLNEQGGMAARQIEIPPKIADQAQLLAVGKFVAERHTGNACGLPYRHLAGEGKPFSRDGLDRFRAWLEAQGLAYNIGQGAERIVLNKTAVDFFIRLESQL